MLHRQLFKNRAICANAALIAMFVTSGAAAGGGGSDDCANAEQIAGDGVFRFDNSTATTDGLPHAACLAFGQDQINNDVWFCWTASITGEVTVETCGLTAVDTKIAAYDGCTCPEGNGLLACNDDACSLQSRITFNAVKGQQYLLRIGTFPLASGGTGSFSIQTSDPPCPADLVVDGDVGVKDLLFLLGAWGPCPKKGDCLADFDNSGDVGVKDLLFLLGAWGPCP